MSNKLLRVLYGSPDRPLKIGNLKIPCYVLEDEIRVFCEQGMQTVLALDQRHGSFVKGLLAHKTIHPFIHKRLGEALSRPLRFILPESRGKQGVGYEASLLGEICNAVLDAREAGLLSKDQLLMAKRCEILARALSKVGIIPLVDEATGYQEMRDRLTLQEMLAKYASKELLPWTLRFPDDFYKELFRLRNWQWKSISLIRPSSLGKLMHDIVYERLSPVVVEELKRMAPRDERGRTKKAYHHSATIDVGHPALNNHLYAIIALMRASVSWDVFRRGVQRAFPKPGDQHLDLEEE
jgi:hypothetical protein